MYIKEEDLQRYVSADYSRRVVVPSNISEKKAHDIAERLRNLDNESDELIVVEIVSNGGEQNAVTILSSVMLATENLRVLRSKTLGIVYGRCFSAGFTVLQMCNMRYTLPSGRFFLHNNWASFRVTPDLDPKQASEMAELMTLRVKKVRDSILSILLIKLTHFSRGELISIMDHAEEDGPIDADVALHKGFIDGIIPLPA